MPENEAVIEGYEVTQALRRRERFFYIIGLCACLIVAGCSSGANGRSTVKFRNSADAMCKSAINREASFVVPVDHTATATNLSVLSGLLHAASRSLSGLRPPSGEETDYHALLTVLNQMGALVDTLRSTSNAISRDHALMNATSRAGRLASEFTATAESLALPSCADLATTTDSNRI